MQPLNLSTHCLENWQTSFPKPQDGILGVIVDQLGRALAAAPKFLLPAGGRPMDDPKSLARMLGVMRLPYPCVALEYLADGVVGEKEARCSKRISLVWDLQHGCPEAFQVLFGTSLSPRRSLLIQSISYVDQENLWMPIMGMMEIHLDQPAQKMHSEEISSDLLDLVQHRMLGKPGQLLQTYSSTTRVYLDEMIEEYGLEQAENLVTADSGDEVMAALSFAALTSCANVSFESLPASPALNKKRLSKNKLAFYDVRMLMVGEQGYRAAGPASHAGMGGQHAGPKTHLRRGHIRRLDTKDIWVNAAVVNPGQAEARPPSYVLARPKLQTKAQQ